MSAGGSRVANAPLREAFLTSGRAAVEVARAAGWYMKPSPAWRRRHPNSADQGNAPRLRTALGLKPTVDRKGRRTYRKTVSYDMAICRALDLDPNRRGALVPALGLT